MRHGSGASPRIVEIRLDADPESWESAGFALSDGALRIGATTISFEPGCRSDAGAICGWTLTGVGDGEFDGLPTTVVEPSEEPDAEAPEHPGTAIAIDHVVVFSSSLERTIAGFEASGVECRRIREIPIADDRTRQAFFRLGESIVEVVEVPVEKAGPEGRARFWGIAFAVADLERAVSVLGEHAGPIRDAVQPGRRIAPIRREAGLGVSVALMTPAERRPVDGTPACRRN